MVFTFSFLRRGNYLILLLSLYLASFIHGFSQPRIISLEKAAKTSSHTIRMNLIHHDTLTTDLQSILHYTSTLLTSGNDATLTSSTTIMCPDFGQPGWGPFCFLNGNPVFNAFDQFQAFVQNSIISLHDTLKIYGIQNAYGPSIILFTLGVRVLLFPVTYSQLASTQKTQALQPKLQEIREKYPDKQEQAQLTALLYQESKVNPLAGCLPALLQIPVFISLYRSFQNLATDERLNEPFLWLPNLAGPVYGERSSDWIFKGWNELTPQLGWTDTLSFLSIPIILIIAQAVSLQILTPKSDDPAMQRSQQILKYLPLMIGYFSLSVPAGLGLYWITNNILSTISTASVREYFKRYPIKLENVDLDTLLNTEFAKTVNPMWGYKNKEDMLQEARINYTPQRLKLIPDDF